ncbi:unnamed protein product [Clonostachys solani]|uniref:Rhodopsin domain-containing protein n=1 Tax=Clonostachys solani TaxID=160281 RepID=A0A9N9W661_9HYPO|nr:unnamed protein product [Clonostachys solani]
MATDPFIIEAFSYLAICVVVVLFRTFCRVKQTGWVGLGPDDYLMLACLVPLLTETILAYNVGAQFRGLSNSNMADDERAALSPDSDEWRWRVGGSKVQIAGWAIYTTLIWMIKASMCAFYMRLTAGLTGYRIRIYIGFGGIIASYIACMCSILFSCQPFEKLWQIYPNPGNVCLPAANKVNIYISMTLNFVTDLYLFMIPIPMLWAAQLPKVKRIGLIVLFSGGILIMVFGILRCTSILKSEATGPKEGAAWGMRESFVAIITTSLPMTWGWVRQMLRPILGSLLSSNKDRATKTSRRTHPEPGSIMLGDTSDTSWRGGQRNRSAAVYSGSRASRNDVFVHTGGTASSEENILPGGKRGGITKQVELTVSTAEVPAPASSDVSRTSCR